VLSKPMTLRGLIATDGLPGCTDMSLGDQLRQRAALCGEKEPAELAAFERSRYWRERLPTLWSLNNDEMRPQRRALTYSP
jgi:hypothetical protein